MNARQINSIIINTIITLTFAVCKIACVFKLLDRNTGRKECEIILVALVLLLFSFVVFVSLCLYFTGKPPHEKKITFN